MWWKMSDDVADEVMSENGQHQNLVAYDSASDAESTPLLSRGLLH